METQQLQALLQRWAKLEPGRCKQYPAFFKVLLDGEEEIINSVHRGKKRQATIEYAVREAILARGWRYDTASPGNGKDYWDIQLAYGSGDGRILWTEGKAEQPAIALLQAYLTALEGVN